MIILNKVDYKVERILKKAIKDRQVIKFDDLFVDVSFDNSFKNIALKMKENSDDYCFNMPYKIIKNNNNTYSYKWSTKVKNNNGQAFVYTNNSENFKASPLCYYVDPYKNFSDYILDNKKRYFNNNFKEFKQAINELKIFHINMLMHEHINVMTGIKNNAVFNKEYLRLVKKVNDFQNHIECIEWCIKHNVNHLDITLVQKSMRKLQLGF